MLYFRYIVCDFIYDPEKDNNNNWKKKISFSELPDTWKCPGCGANKNFFAQDNSLKNNFIEKKMK